MYLTRRFRQRSATLHTHPKYIYDRELGQSGTTRYTPLMKYPPHTHTYCARAHKRTRTCACTLHAPPPAAFALSLLTLTHGSLAFVDLLSRHDEQDRRARVSMLLLLLGSLFSRSSVRCARVCVFGAQWRCGSTFSSHTWLVSKRAPSVQHILAGRSANRSHGRANTVEVRVVYLSVNVGHSGSECASLRIVIVFRVT